MLSSSISFMILVIIMINQTLICIYELNAKTVVTKVERRIQRTIRPDGV